MRVMAISLACWSGIYAQIAVAVSHSWIQLPTKGDLSGSLSNINQGTYEFFLKEIGGHLLNAAGRIFGDPQRVFLLSSN